MVFKLRPFYVLHTQAVDKTTWGGGIMDIEWKRIGEIVRMM